MFGLFNKNKKIQELSEATRVLVISTAKSVGIDFNDRNHELRVRDDLYFIGYIAGICSFSTSMANLNDTDKGIVIIKSYEIIFPSYGGSLAKTYLEGMKKKDMTMFNGFSDGLKEVKMSFGDMIGRDEPLALENLTSHLLNTYLNDETNI
jgi:hypothetical protein